LANAALRTKHAVMRLRVLMLVTSCTRARRLEIASDGGEPRLRNEHAPCRIGRIATPESQLV